MKMHEKLQKQKSKKYICLQTSKIQHQIYILTVHLLQLRCERTQDQNTPKFITLPAMTFQTIHTYVICKLTESVMWNRKGLNIKDLQI